MRSIYAGIIVVLLTSCSAFTAQQEESFANSVSIVRAFAEDYSEVNCQECASCVARVSLYGEARVKVLTLTMPEESTYRIYAVEIDDLAARTEATACDCTADSNLCPPAKEAMSLEALKAKEVVEHLDRESGPLALLGGIWGGIHKGLGGVFGSLFDLLFKEETAPVEPIPPAEPPPASEPAPAVEPVTEVSNG